MQLVQLDHRCRRVELRTPERAAEFHAIGADARGFFGRKALDAEALDFRRCRKADATVRGLFLMNSSSC
jgi:hypothetical protein